MWLLEEKICYYSSMISPNPSAASHCKLHKAPACSEGCCEPTQSSNPRLEAGLVMNFKVVMQNLHGQQIA